MGIVELTSTTIAGVHRIKVFNPKLRHYLSSPPLSCISISSHFWIYRGQKKV